MAQERATERTPIWAMLLVAFCTLLLAAAQILMKQGLRSEAVLVILLGFILQAVAGLFITFSLKHGDLSVLYPIVALGFIWVAMAGAMLFGETLHARQYAGIAMIIIGVSLIGHRARRKA
jgi:drug/metabolite transporter (DMT)-like permease